MKRLHLLALFVGLFLCAHPAGWALPAAHAQENKPIPGIGHIGEMIEVADGYRAPGPIAGDPQGNIYFADNGGKEKAGVIHKITPTGEVEVFHTFEDTCSGLAYDPKGRLLASLLESKQIVAFDVASKEMTVLADSFNGEPFEKPTGVAVDDHDGVYFSDPPAQAIYYVSADNQVTRLIENVPAPGEVLVAPNGKTLYVVLKETPMVMAYALNSKEPGTLDEKKKSGVVFATLKRPEKGDFKGSTGATLDRKGNLFIASAADVQVFDPEGKYLGSVTFPEAPRDCAFGGAEGKSLHVTTATSVYKTHIDIPFDPYPLFLLGIGILCIFVLIIWLRVHAFLALIGAALLIGLLSPRIIFGTDPATTMPVLEILNVPTQIAFEFGQLMGRIGLAIAFATIIGKAMMDSGAADRIVRFFIRLFGERFSPVALLASGFILSIPVFFDNVFLLLVPLAKVLYIRTGKNYLLYVIAIGAGGAVTHSTVPPTPGPIVMSQILHVDLGYTILVGVLVGLPVSLVGFAYAAFINSRMPVELRESGSVSLAELEQQAQVEDSKLPPLWLAFLPIVLPVLFITSRTVFSAMVGIDPTLNQPRELAGMVVRPLAILDFFGNPNIALLIAAILAMLMVFRQRRMSRPQLTKFTAAALDEAGMILLITSAGGAFGAMLTNVGVGESLGALANMFGVELLVLAWGLAVLFKVAQGSGTVSMITSAGIVWGILKAQLDIAYPGQTVTSELIAQHLGYHPVYLVMAIGVGSKIASWMNDSGFWVVSRMGGLTETETIKSWTMCLISMGLFGLPFVWIMTRILPLV